MGNICNKCVKKKVPNESTINLFDNMISLKICSFNARLIQTPQNEYRLAELIEYITTDTYDVMCIQGIYDNKILRYIVKQIFNFNVRSEKIKLSIFPTLDFFYMNSKSERDILKITWSDSNNFEMKGISSLTITKHTILNGTKINFSIDSSPNSGLYICNIIYNNIIISIYNISLENDNIGILNSSVRQEQIKNIKDKINLNVDHINNDEIYQKYDKRNIHILCCLSNIMEIYNNDINQEYLYFIRTLKCIDTYRYIQTIKDIRPDISKDITNKGGYRSNYILLYVNDISNTININDISEKIYKKRKIVIFDTSVDKTMILYEDYPISTNFLVEKSSIVGDPLNSDLDISTSDDNIAIEIDT